MTYTPALDEDFNLGHQRIYRFDNGYGASVVEGKFYSGGRELAVLKFNGPTIDDWDIVYYTPVADDVIGGLELEEVEPLLDRIAALPTKGDKE